MIPIGTRIRFKRTIDQGPTEDTPAFEFAKKGDTGIIMKNDQEGQWKYSVLNDNWRHATFLCSEEEFEVIE